MRNRDRASARQQLDMRLNSLQSSQPLLSPPAAGWIRALRDALGMTAAQLGKRLGVSQQRALAIENGEASGSITLASLVRAANALDCRLIYAVVPRSTLESLVEERAVMLARKRLTPIPDGKAHEAAQFEQLVRHFVEHSGSKLWDEV